MPGWQEDARMPGYPDYARMPGCMQIRKCPDRKPVPGSPDTAPRMTTRILSIAQLTESALLTNSRSRLANCCCNPRTYAAPHQEANSFDSSNSRLGVGCGSPQSNWALRVCSRALSCDGGPAQREEIPASSSHSRFCARITNQSASSLNQSES